MTSLAFGLGIDSLLAIVPDRSPLKVNVAVELDGSVCFTSLIVPRCRFVKVQVMTAPGCTLMLAVRAEGEAVVLPALPWSATQDSPVRSQPSLADSVTL